MAHYLCRAILLPLVLLLCILSGCGQSGDLYLPDEAEQSDADEEKQL